MEWRQPSRIFLISVIALVFLLALTSAVSAATQTVTLGPSSYLDPEMSGLAEGFETPPEIDITFGETSKNDLLVFKVGDSSITLNLVGAKEVDAQKPLSSKIIYENIFPYTSLVYKTSPYGVKEEIILRKYTNKNEFVYHVEVENAVWAEKENGDIIFTHPETGEHLWTFKAPFMKDSPRPVINYQGSQKDVEMTLTENKDGSLFLKLTADDQWLQEAYYPVVIDPTITVILRQYPFMGFQGQLALPTPTYSYYYYSRTYSYYGPYGFCLIPSWSGCYYYSTFYNPSSYYGYTCPTYGQAHCDSGAYAWTTYPMYYYASSSYVNRVGRHCNPQNYYWITTSSGWWNTYTWNYYQYSYYSSPNYYYSNTDGTYFYTNSYPSSFWNWRLGTAFYKYSYPAFKYTKYYYYTTPQCFTYSYTGSYPYTTGGCTYTLTRPVFDYDYMDVYMDWKLMVL